MIAHIYRITNLVNGKMYVGQHDGSNKNYFAGGKLIKKAIKKYGKENFKREILVEGLFSKEELNELEIKHIKEQCVYFHEYPERGYNLTKGGAGQRELKHTKKTKEFLTLNSPKRIPIVQLDMDGNYINTFSSARFASSQTNIIRSSILRCCKEKGLENNKSAGGFRWCYESDYKSGNYVIKPIWENTKEVKQYTLSGEFITNYKSAGEAAKCVGVSRNSVLNVIYGITHTSAGFKWSF